MPKLKRRQTDRARAKTDKRLESLERKIGRVYERHPALNAAKKKYFKYMKSVKEATKEEYNTYQREDDPERKAELKKIYSDKIDMLTRRSREYRKIVSEFTSAMAQANQEAVDLVNNEMVDVYVDNYNEIATECRRVGIRVNG